MLYLLLGIICSVSVGVIFKISRRYENDNVQIVWFNYIFALLLCAIAFTPNLTAIDNSAPFLVYGSLGILLPIVFLFLIASISHIGIVKTDAAQRLALFIPILAAWLIFDEVFTTYKVVGICVGFMALFFILAKPTTSKNTNWYFPLLVFFGYGIIDVLFKKVAVYTAIPYTTSLFIVFALALVVMTVPVFYKLIAKNQPFTSRNLLFGFLIGVFNFCNILFYLKAHKSFSDSPSTVFAGMNMGVILLGSLVGIFAFKEKLSKLNYIGLALALVSILFIVG